MVFVLSWPTITSLRSGQDPPPKSEALAVLQVLAGNDWPGQCDLLWQGSELNGSCTVPQTSADSYFTTKLLHFEIRGKHRVAIAEPGKKVGHDQGIPA